MQNADRSTAVAQSFVVADADVDDTVAFLVVTSMGTLRTGSDVVDVENS